MCASNTTVIIIIIIAIAVFAYLYWEINNPKDKYNLQNQMTNLIPNNMREDFDLTQNFGNELNEIQKELSNYSNKNLTPTIKSNVQSFLNSRISTINNNFDNFLKKISSSINNMTPAQKQTIKSYISDLDTKIRNFNNAVSPYTTSKIEQLYSKLDNYTLNYPPSVMTYSNSLSNGTHLGSSQHNNHPSLSHTSPSNISVPAFSNLPNNLRGNLRVDLDVVPYNSDSFDIEAANTVPEYYPFDKF